MNFVRTCKQAADKLMSLQNKDLVKKTRPLLYHLPKSLHHSSFQFDV